MDICIAYVRITSSGGSISFWTCREYLKILSYHSFHYQYLVMVGLMMLSFYLIYEFSIN